MNLKPPRMLAVMDRAEVFCLLAAHGLTDKMLGELRATAQIKYGQELIDVQDVRKAVGVKGVLKALSDLNGGA